MKQFLHPRDGASEGAALIIVLAFVVLATALGVAYLSRTTTDRQLAQTSYNDTSADLLARSALDSVVGGFKREIIRAGGVTSSNIQPQRWGGDASIPNLVRRSARDDNNIPFPGVPSLASAVPSGPVSPTNPQRGEITSARWNSHYLIPSGATFIAPDWVLITPTGPNSVPASSDVIGRYAFAVYDEGGLIDVNLGGFPNYASLTRPDRPDRPARPGRRLRARYPLEESEIMLVAGNCEPKFTPEVTNVTLATGVPCSILFNTNHNPDSFGASYLPGGLSINTTNGNITGTPTGPGQWTVTVSATNQCGTGTGTLHLTIQGFPSPESTPWPVNLARKGTVAFADLTTLPATPALSTTQVNKLMGWRNYATTQQPAAFFANGNPWFPPGPPNDPIKDLYARYFLGAIPPFTTPFTAVSAVSWGTAPNLRTDQALMNRQELIRLQRTIGFSQSLLQYLGTFSREYNRPAPSWSQLSGSLSSARWDMNNLQLMIPAPWYYPGNHGQGHAYGKQRNDDLEGLFGLVWVPGNFGSAGDRFTDPNFYGHWKYVHQLNPLPTNDDPDFFQIIDYAMNQAINRNDPNHVRNTFTIGAAIIDQYDTDDLHDSGVGGSETGNTITIIDPYGTGIYTNYVYGIERMSFDDPLQNLDRPPFAPNPLSLGVPSNYVFLNRRFENVGEFGYAYNPASTTASKTLDFASAGSNDRALLDFFTYNSASNRAGVVNLNTKNGPVLASIIAGALLHDPGDTENIPTSLVSPTAALAAGQAIVQETTNNPVLTRGDVARLAAVAGPALGGSDEAKQTIARALAEVGKARTWNLMIDVIAQTGNYAPGTLPSQLGDPTKFIVQGEKRYWLHIALDRDDATVLGTQLEEVIE